MRARLRKVRITTALLSLCAVVASHSRPAYSQFEQVVRNVTPSVVQVLVETTQGRASGTGFVIDSSGYIMTARHVIEDATRVAVRLSDGRSVPAVIVRYSELFDAAILKIDGSVPPALSLNPSQPARQGQEVLVFGYPLSPALGNDTLTVTRGILSALRPAQGFIQIDAAINPGNSGGPVTNTRGEVIGMAVARLRDGVLIGLAVPTELLRTIAVNLQPVAVPAPRSTSPRQAGPEPAPPGPGIGPEGNWTIVPGRRVGPVQLEMSLLDVVRIYGPPVGRDVIDGYVFHRFVVGEQSPGSPTTGVEVVLSASTIGGRPIEMLIVSSRQFATPAGGRVGSSLRDFIAEFGEPSRTPQRSLSNTATVGWPSRGLLASYDAATTAVVLIGVYAVPR